MWLAKLGQRTWARITCRATEYHRDASLCALQEYTFFSRAAAVKAALHTKLEAAFPGLRQKFYENFRENWPGEGCRDLGL